MKTFIKKGIEKLPLVYQLANSINTGNEDTNKDNDIKIKRMIKISAYNSQISDGMLPNKPISKII